MRQIDIEFNNFVNNMVMIARENVHEFELGKDFKTFGKTDAIITTLHDINFLISFKEGKDYTEYLHFIRMKLLDIMDLLLLKRDFFKSGTNEYIALNSLYDCVREFYFNAVDKYDM